jgi:hypothetical protein
MIKYLASVVNRSRYSEPMVTDPVRVGREVTAFLNNNNPVGALVIMRKLQNNFGEIYNTLHQQTQLNLTQAIHEITTEQVSEIAVIMSKMNSEISRRNKDKDLFPMSYNRHNNKYRK